MSSNKLIAQAANMSLCQIEIHWVWTIMQLLTPSPTLRTIIQLLIPSLTLRTNQDGSSKTQFPCSSYLNAKLVYACNILRTRSSSRNGPAQILQVVLKLDACGIMPMSGP